MKTGIIKYDLLLYKYSFLDEILTSALLSGTWLLVDELLQFDVVLDKEFEDRFSITGFLKK